MVRSRHLALAAVLALGCVLAACAGEPLDGDPALGAASGAVEDGSPTTAACSTPTLGCACDSPTARVECGEVLSVGETTVECATGFRSCVDGAWGRCVTSGRATVPRPSPAIAGKALASTAPKCSDNPCDPFCKNYIDNGAGFPAKDGIGSTPAGGLSLVATPPPPNAVTCTSIVLEPVGGTDIVVSSIKSGFSGGPIKAEYFAQLDKSASKISNSWVPIASRGETDINYSTVSPGVTGLPGSNFSIRWTGRIVVPTSGAYTFRTSSDDGARLWLGGTLVVDKWVDQGTTEWAAPAVTMVGGQTLDFVYEYYQAGGGSSAKLLWQGPGISKQAVPASAFVTIPGASDPFTATPKTLEFNVRAEPAGCYKGVLKATWSLDKLDRSTVSSVTTTPLPTGQTPAKGRLELFSPLSGPIEVSAFIGGFAAKQSVNVRVDAKDTTGAPSGAETNFAKSVTEADPLTVLYPYDGVVLPLAITPPLLMWDSGGKASDAIKIGLVYPPTGTPSFKWERLMVEPANGRFQLPTEVWSALEKTAKGQTAVITFQRLFGNKPGPLLNRSVRFANAPLRGRIYYTQYGRNGSTRIMVADPSATTGAQNAFPNTNGCPVCHTVSANGKVFTTVNSPQGSTNAGFSLIGSDSKLTPIADFPTPTATYSAGGNDWRGFAWAPLTPDGKLALSTNNMYGNTRQTVVGIDTTTRTVSINLRKQSGASGTGLFARFTDSNTNFVRDRTLPQVNHNFGTTGPGSLVGQFFTSDIRGSVVPYFTGNVTFEVESTDGVALTLNGNLLVNDLNYEGATLKRTATVAMTAGVPMSIRLQHRNTAADATLYLRWGMPGRLTTELIPTSQLIPDMTFVPNGSAYRGLDVTYYDNGNYTSPQFTRLEPQVNANWGSASFAPGYDGDQWSLQYRGRLRAPFTGTVFICPRNVDDTLSLLRVGSTTLFGTGAKGATSGTPSGCNDIALTQDQLYDLSVDYAEGTGNARFELRWRAATPALAEEAIPHAYLQPPASWVPPTNGLMASYYRSNASGQDFGSTLYAQAFTRVDPFIDFQWGNGRPEQSLLTSNDNFSVRWTGELAAACDGLFEFQFVGDDRGRLYLDGDRVLRLGSNGTTTGVRYLTAGRHSFKFDFEESSNAATAQLQWKNPCVSGGTNAFVTIPNSAFFTSGSTTGAVVSGGLGGFNYDGGENWNGVDYVTWQTPQAAGEVPVDTTAQSRGAWGLDGTAMMVPSFSPDGSKLVYIDGDGASNQGWRKGLSVFDYDAANKLFKNRRGVTGTWPFGDVMKWPIFESDSRSVIYQRQPPASYCCINGWTAYGYMAPTDYYEQPSQLYSIDTAAATPTPVALTKLNSGERAIDANKAYQATMLPTAAAGYRWAVFTSTRPYGNLFNLEAQEDYSNTASYTSMLTASKIQSMLWVAAVDDTTSGATDRSKPAFFLPNQNYSSDPASGFINERGFWALEPCRGLAATCDVNEDCCGGTGASPTAACQLDTPVTAPPVRSCQAKPPVTSCQLTGGVCAQNSECCAGLVCASAQCASPPSLDLFYTQNFERIYEIDCVSGTEGLWRFFDWKAVTPPGTKIEFYAETSADKATFLTLPLSPTVVSDPKIFALGNAEGNTPPGWIGQNVGALLSARGIKSKRFLKITMRLIPDASETTAPVIYDWRQSFSCIESQ